MNIFTDQLNFNKIIFRDKIYYPKEINASIDKLSSYLNTNKTSNSPFVYLFAHNHIKTVIAYFAIIRSNRICVLVDPEIKHIELNELMQDTPPYAIIKFNNMSERFDYEKYISFTKNNIEIKDQLDDVCTMVYTAAEDGYAKAVMLTRKNIFTNAESHATTNHSDKNSVMCALLPFYHLFGLVIGVIATALSNASLLIEDHSNLRRIKSISDNFEKYKLTHLYTVPVIYYLLSKIPRIKDKLGSIQFLTSGGYKLPLSIFKFYKEELNLEIHEGYGLTEASPVCTWHHPDKKVKPGSVGQPFRCCNIQIFNENNSELPHGQIGEIYVKGDNVMKGYYNNRNATQKVIKIGWLHTGDLGVIDEDGYVYVTGLKKQMFNVAGKNVYPAEVERLIKLNENVISINVSGDWKELQGHIIKAKITLRNKNDGAMEELRKWCFENISNHKIPHILEFE